MSLKSQEISKKICFLSRANEPRLLDPDAKALPSGCRTFLPPFKVKFIRMNINNIYYQYQKQVHQHPYQLA